MNSDAGLSTGWKEAIPFFVVSGLSVLLLFDPGAPVLIEPGDYTALILAEGLVIFFCFVFTGMMIQSARVHGGILRRPGPSALIFSAAAATFWGGLLATFEGGMTTMALYCGLLISHLLWLGGASMEAAMQEAGLLAKAFLLYLACGATVAMIRVPKLSMSYPKACLDCDLSFDLPTQNVLAFGVVYFALIGILNLRGHRSMPSPEAEEPAGTTATAAPRKSRELLNPPGDHR